MDISQSLTINISGHLIKLDTSLKLGHFSNLGTFQNWALFKVGHFSKLDISQSLTINKSGHFSKVGTLFQVGHLSKLNIS